METIKYQTEEEAQTIIATKTGQGLILIEVANITEGNFLTFSDTPPPLSTRDKSYLIGALYIKGKLAAKRAGVTI